IPADGLPMAERDRLAFENRFRNLAILVVVRPILALGLLFAFGRMGGFDLDFPFIRLFAGQPLPLSRAEVRRALSQFVTAGGESPLFATGLVALGQGLAFALALTVAFAQALALFHQQVTELLAFALLACFAAEFFDSVLE